MSLFQALQSLPTNWLAKTNLWQVQSILQSLVNYPWAGNGNLHVNVTETAESTLPVIPVRLRGRGRPRRNEPGPSQPDTTPSRTVFEEVSPTIEEMETDESTSSFEPVKYIDVSKLSFFSCFPNFKIYFRFYRIQVTQVTRKTR